MKVAPQPDDEKERLARLKDYKILDTLPEQEFDDLTYLAAKICDVPIALISFIDEERQWFKSRIGIDASETSRDLAFCAHAILQDNVFLVPDARADERFFDHPFVVEDPKVSFYAGAPLTTSNGHKVGTLCVIDTAPKNLSADQVTALRALARQVMSQLELRSSLKNCDVIQKALGEAKEAAEAALRTKSEFLANMSHEIRTPMNGIIGLTDLLLDTDLNELQKDKLKLIQGCGQSLLELINEVLDFSKLEAQKIYLETRAFHFREMIEETIKLCEVLATKKNLKLTCTLDEATPIFIEGDSNRIRQIMMNVISNAIKFTAEGEIKINVKKIETSPNSKSQILIAVKDTGPGIPQSLQHRLFKSFSQVDASTTRRFGGTGLGLAIAKGLCERMGGRIWVESEVGQGALFQFTFDAKITNQNEIKTREATLRTPLYRGLNILVAEDNRVNQTVIVGLLTKHGHKIDVVSDGHEALSALSASSYDVIFMDCHMPNLDGFSATQMILDNEARYGKPWIIALTASVLEEDKKKCFDAGMDDFLSKPIRSHDLERSLRFANVRKVKNMQTPLVDEKNLIETYSGMHDVLVQVIHQFIQDYPALMTQIQKALANSEAKSLTISAHSLRGMLAELHSQECENLATELEHIGRSGHLSSARVSFAQLQSKIIFVEGELKALLKKVA